MPVANTPLQPTAWAVAQPGAVQYLYVSQNLAEVKAFAGRLPGHLELPIRPLYETPPTLASLAARINELERMLAARDPWTQAELAALNDGLAQLEADPRPDKSSAIAA